MMIFRGSGLVRLMRRLVDTPRNYEALTVENDEKYAEILLARVKLYASGRPGPNIVTGQYVGSFYAFHRGRRFGVTNDSPQTARLEFGFSGIDAAGRTYHQPPFPHMHPALNEVRKEYRDSLKELAREAWRIS